MKAKEVALIEALTKFKKVGMKPYLIGEVLSVGDRDCVVQVGDTKIEGVSLQVTDEGATGKFIKYPKIGTAVLMASLSGDMADLVVLACDEVAKIVWQEGDLKLVIDSTGKLSLKIKEVDLAQTLKNLCTAMKTLKVLTPAGPSTGLTPDSLQKVVALEQDFEKLFTS